VAIFQQDPLFEMCKQMRRWDEGAKVEGLEMPNLEHYIPMVRRCVVSAPGPPRDSATFKRAGNRIIGVQSRGNADAVPPDAKKVKA